MFDETQRQIFLYFNGIKEVKGDPLSIHRKLHLACRKEGHDIEQLIDSVMRLPEVSNGKKKKKGDIELENIALAAHHEATEALLSVIMSGFGVKPVDEDGLTEQEMMQLLADFMAYISALKKNIETLPSSSSSTDSHQWDRPPILPMNVS